MVFGGYKRGSGRVFMVPVESRGKGALLSIIKKFIKPQMTIISGKSMIASKMRVNHSLNFKDPKTGAHTNRIGLMWPAAKVLVFSTGRIHILGNLARYMFLAILKNLIFSY